MSDYDELEKDCFTFSIEVDVGVVVHSIKAFGTDFKKIS